MRRALNLAMKIVDIRILGRNLPNFSLVEVETDAGITGIGGADGFGPAINAILETGPRSLRKLLLGEDAGDVARLWRKMVQHFGSQSGPFTNAMGAVDMALWDIAGKAQGTPIYKLLGGAVKPKLMAYASATAFQVTSEAPNAPLRHKPLEMLVQESRNYVQHGFKAIKFGWGNYFNPDDQEKLAAIREAVGPNTRLMLDFGNPAYWTEGWNGNEATRVARICESFDIFFLEEPLPPFDVEGYAELSSAVDVKIASGEMLSATHEFERFIQRRALDVIQPDAFRIGISQTLQAGRMAESAGILCVPHSPWSALAIAAHVNILATLSNGEMVEYPATGLYVDEGRLWGQTVHIMNQELVERPLRLQEGFLPLPDSPGLGLGGFDSGAVTRLESLYPSETK